MLRALALAITVLSLGYFAMRGAHNDLPTGDYVEYEAVDGTIVRVSMVNPNKLQ